MNLNLELYCYLQYKVKKPVVHKCKYFLVNALESFPSVQIQCPVNKAQSLLTQDPISMGCCQAAVSFPLANVVYLILYLTPLITK